MPDLSDKVSERPDGVPDDVWEMAGKALGSPAFNRDTIRVRIANIIMADRRTRPTASSMEGWRLVPEEPTDEQIAVGLESLAESTQEPMMHIVRDALFCYRRMVRSAPIPPPMEGWRTMDSAPKDGTKVDLWVIGSDGQAHRYTDCWWKAEPKEWNLCGLMESQYSTRPKITHWHPITEPASPIPPEVMK